MDEKTLNKYFRDLKFVVLANIKTGKAFEIFFDFHLPSMHSEIFAVAKEQFSKQGIDISVHGGGRITKKDNYIIFHGTSQKYKRYEDDVVLSLAEKHPIFKENNFVFLSKAGEDNFSKIIERYEKQD